MRHKEVPDPGRSPDRRGCDSECFAVMVSVMETTRRSGSMPFSRQIERRLKETNRSDQAAAFERLARLRILLDILIKRLDFEEIVANIGEFSLDLERKTQGRDPMSDTQTDLLRLCSGPPQGTPVAGSLDDLEPVGELSEAYAHPDFGNQRSHSSDFLRK